MEKACHERIVENDPRVPAGATVPATKLKAMAERTRTSTLGRTRWVMPLVCALAATAAATGAAATSSPKRSILTTASIARWAPVVEEVTARAKPSAASARVAPLSLVTGDGTQNLVLILEQTDLGHGVIWHKVRLPILPNNSTGWVPQSALGNVYTVRTHLWIDRSAFTARLTRNGKTIFTTRVGVGKPGTPTPSGEFYVRDKITNFNNPFYGPIAFGTSARSPVLTDWPGGGFIGVHGTNEPERIPGAPSHGCIRIANADILKLASLMPVGTPLTIT